MKEITISEVNKKHLRVIGYLTISWILSLVLVFITKNPFLVGLAPVFDYILFAVRKELKGEGYIKAK